MPYVTRTWLPSLVRRHWPSYNYRDGHLHLRQQAKSGRFLRVGPYGPSCFRHITCRRPYGTKAAPCLPAASRRVRSAHKLRALQCRSLASPKWRGPAALARRCCAELGSSSVLRLLWPWRGVGMGNTSAGRLACPGRDAAAGIKGSEALCLGKACVGRQCAVILGMIAVCYTCHNVCWAAGPAATARAACMWLWSAAHFGGLHSLVAACTRLWRFAHHVGSVQVLTTIDHLLGGQKLVVAVWSPL